LLEKLVVCVASNIQRYLYIIEYTLYIDNWVVIPSMYYKDF